MAKKSDKDTTADTEPTAMTALSQYVSPTMAEFDAVLAARPKLEGTLAEELARIAEENDQFNTWKPNPGDRIIGRFLEARKIDETAKDGKREPGVLVSMYDYITAKIRRTFLGEHILKRLVGANVHVTGMPFCLTYRGKVKAKVAGNSDAHSWDFYPFSPAEAAKFITQ